MVRIGIMQCKLRCTERFTHHEHASCDVPRTKRQCRCGVDLLRIPYQRGGGLGASTSERSLVPTSRAPPARNGLVNKVEFLGLISQNGGRPMRLRDC